MAHYQLYFEQFIPATTKEVWNFISSPHNLQRITPPEMGFDITSVHLPDEMYAGMIITYRVKPLLGIPTTWVTEITQVEEEHFFIDEQRIGPYKLWHHQHHISPVDGGVLMKDIITYQPPMGFLGRIVNGIVIKKKLDQIFVYRKRAIERIFPG